MIETYHRLNQEKTAAKEELNKKVAEAGKKIERLEERFILEEIDREMFAKYKEKFLSEKRELEIELAKGGSTISNLKGCVKTCFEYASKLVPLWDSGDYGEMQRLQYMVYPDGIAYDRKNDEYRTGRVNSVFSYMATMAQVLEQNKNGETDCNINFPAWVVWAGIEPATHGFSVHCSTN